MSVIKRRDCWSKQQRSSSSSPAKKKWRTHVMGAPSSDDFRIYLDNPSSEYSITGTVWQTPSRNISVNRRSRSTSF
ncbi:predicted protein [Arabidopsis lyrata subsp. lyrata]|uniref:Predicted protein n=1 Tax=Arabidopsis lyrata subsp. lyrata TaxID=81972 RepID=D7KFE3_ARALL|nr:predicted protein [Arabidopsis lyrata subsp. lyrata]